MYGNAIDNLITQLGRLPGIGIKSAHRIAFHMINNRQFTNDLISAISHAKNDLRYCTLCCNLTDEKLCCVCSNPKRNQNLIMVVEDPRDMGAYEHTGQFNGVYHVLHGAISPMNNIGPNDLRIKELVSRLSDEHEVVLATNATVEGEATAIYLSKLIKPLGVKVTRIAHGIPIGGDIQYADDVTLLKALEGRRDI